MTQPKPRPRKAKLPRKSAEYTIDFDFVGRRERIATAALAGLLANPQSFDADPSDFARAAVECADALIAELDK